MPRNRSDKKKEHKDKLLGPDITSVGLWKCRPPRTPETPENSKELKISGPQKGPAERGHVKKRQKSSKSVKNIFDTFRHFSRRAKKHQKSSESVKTLFDNFRAAPVFRPLLGGPDKSDYKVTFRVPRKVTLKVTRKVTFELLWISWGFRGSRRCGLSQPHWSGVSSMSSGGGQNVQYVPRKIVGTSWEGPSIRLQF